MFKTHVAYDVLVIVQIARLAQIHQCIWGKWEKKLPEAIFGAELGKSNYEDYIVGGA